MNAKTIEGLYPLESLKEILDEKEIQINSVNIIYDIVYKNKEIDKLLEIMK